MERLDACAMARRERADEPLIDEADWIVGAATVIGMAAARG